MTYIYGSYTSMSALLQVDMLILVPAEYLNVGSDLTNHPFVTKAVQKVVLNLQFRPL